MIIVMPMAGRGSRFADVGVTTPKPLIPVRGRPMYSWAMDSLPLYLASRVVFICLESHLRESELDADIRSRYSALDPVIVSLDHVTEGQACTVLKARQFIEPDEPLIIYNADTYARSGIGELIERAESGVDGYVTVFQAPGDKWSFARTDASGNVVETAEKRRISDWASTGLYHFSRGETFLRHADDMITANDRAGSEFYVAPIYNRVIHAGGRIRLDVASEVWVLGTPEDLAQFEAGYPER